MESKKNSTERQEQPPYASLARDLFLSGGLDETHYSTGDVTLFAVFLSPDIAVTHQCDVVSIDREDAVENIASFSQMREDHISHFDVLFLAERDTVFLTAQIRQHTVAFGQNDDLLTFGKKICNLFEKNVVWDDSLFHYAVTVSWHRTAAASSGRQSSVKQGILRTIFSMVLCIPSAMLVTERNPEQDG